MPGKRFLSRGVINQDGFVIAKRLDQSVPFLLWRHKCYEPALSTLFRQYLRPGDTFIDVGANVGYFTLLGSSCVGPSGHVHSFEPNPRVLDELKRNVALNQFDQVAINNIALSNCAGKVPLYIAPEMDSGLSSMRRTSALLTETQTVPAITLDEYIESNGIGKIRAVKIDVEGAELLVLQGARTGLTGSFKPDFIALEFVQQHLAFFGHSRNSVIDFLANLGYELGMLIQDPSSPGRIASWHAHDQLEDGTLIARLIE